MSRNGPTNIHDLLKEYCLKACGSFAESQLTFQIWKRFVWNVFQTHSLSHPTSNLRPRASGGQEYISVSKNDSQEFTWMFRNTLETLWVIQKAFSMTQIDPSPSSSFCRYVYKYKALPPINNNNNIVALMPSDLTVWSHYYFLRIKHLCI